MKNVSNQTIVLSASLMLITSLVGCAFFKNTSPDTIARIATVAYSVSKAGTAAAIMANKDYAPALQRAVYALDAMLAADRSDLSELQRILTNTGIKEFKGSEGLILLEGGLVIYELSSSLFWEPNTKVATTQIITKIRDGIADGLAGVSTLGTRAAIKEAQKTPVRTKNNVRKF